MMTMTLEDSLAAECDRQGIKPSPSKFREMLTEAIGRLDSKGLIALPNGTISIPDFVRSYGSDAKPDAAKSEQDHTPATGNLTESMRREIAANRKRVLPGDWAEVRKGKTGLTAEMMDEVARK